MEIKTSKVLEVKDLTNLRKYIKVEITWDNSKTEEIELWGIDDNIIVTQTYRKDIDKIIHELNHSLHDKILPRDKYFYPLRWFLKKSSLTYDKEMRLYMQTGTFSNPERFFLFPVKTKVSAYLFWDKEKNVAIPLCQFDWFYNDIKDFDALLKELPEPIKFSTFALVCRWTIIRQIHYLWKVKNYGQRYILLEDAGIYDEIIPNIQAAFEFTCPCSYDQHSPAGLLGFPKPFYQANKEILGVEITPIFKIRIDDPYTKLENYSQVKDIMKIVSSEGAPLTITMSQYNKILDNQVLKNRKYDYSDYVRMCNSIGEEPVMPWMIRDDHQLTSLHDTAVKEYNLLKDSSSEKIKAKYLEIKANYPNFSFENQEFIIKYPDDIDDLNTEGAILHHCVKSYKERVLRNETMIMFLRKKDDLTQPYVTMQISKKSNKYDLVQAHGNCNCSIKTLTGVYEFVKEWANKFQIVLENIDRAL